MADKINPIRETDEAARKQARLLLRGARFAAIAAIDPQTGYPSCSRVLLGTAGDGTPVILVSRIASHTKALLNDSRASLLVGEPGKGDPLAWPRLSLQCDAEPVERDSADHQAIRERFLRRHEKAALYADFGDFLFIRLKPVQASLNGGFGKAYLLRLDDLTFIKKINAISVEKETRLLQIILSTWTEIAAEHPRLKDYANWTICGIDREGMDLKNKSTLTRIMFKQLLSDSAIDKALQSEIFTADIED